MHTSLRAILARAAVLSLSAASIAGAGTYAAQGGLTFNTPTHTVSISTTDTPPKTMRVSKAASTTDRPSRETIRTVRALGGIPPCKWEDGSGQPGPCVWLDSRDGEMEGWHVLNVPTRPGEDKRPVLWPSR